jgi:hypothetical protein
MISASQRIAGPGADRIRRSDEWPSSSGCAYHGSMAASKRPAKPASSSKPFLRFYHSEELRSRTLAVLVAIEKSADPAKHRSALADIVVELTSVGMDYYFMKPLKQAEAGFVIQQSASVGMVGAVRVLGSVTRNIISRMDGPQLRSVSEAMRQLMS